MDIGFKSITITKSITIKITIKTQGFFFLFRARKSRQKRVSWASVLIIFFLELRGIHHSHCEFSHMMPT